ncbi:MAG: hypothetical protein SF182_21755 [Deltaproteobacteria bacterium]|nr:hypothetical protein [Deltaproteobacteria bacterium]
MRSRRLGLVLVPMLVLAAGCGDDNDTPRPTPTATASATRTVTATVPPPTFTATAAPTNTVPPPPTSTATLPPTFTATPTGTAQATITATPRPEEPRIVAFGVARADDIVQEPNGFDTAGRPIFTRITGQGLTIYVEAERGRAALEPSTYDADGNPAGLDVIVSRPLGDGSLAVCDYDPPIIGGIPAVDPFQFSDAPMVLDAIADLGCRFNDGTGSPAGRTSANACTRDAGAVFGFVSPAADLQYCLPIARAWSFQPGDTIVAARVRDRAGKLSAPVEFVVRVQGEPPFDCDSTGLGERVFTPTRDNSHFWARLPDGGEASDALRDITVLEPLRMCAGPDLGGGVHQVTLRDTAVFSLSLADGSILCARLAARGSDGTIDCDGGTAQDVLATQVDDPLAPLTVEGGLGLPAGTGAASVSSGVTLSLLPPGATPSDCLEPTGGSFGFPGAFTTARATAQLVDALGTPVLAETREGAPFVCSFWRDGDQGSLVLPFTYVDAVSGKIAAVMQFGE